MNNISPTVCHFLMVGYVLGILSISFQHQLAVAVSFILVTSVEGCYLSKTATPACGEGMLEAAEQTMIAASPQTSDTLKTSQVLDLAVFM